MNDSISRQAAIDAIESAFDRETILNRFVRKIAISAVRLLPSAQPEQRWIPCSERMPEKNGIYFVSYEDADTWLLEWLNGKWFVYPSNPAREETGTITAWMPLPEPYIER